MTKLDDLRALYEAVKAGTATDFRALLTDSNDPAERAKHCGWASGAYRGRLDTAHALMKATLPDATWWRRPDGVMCISIPNCLTIFTGEDPDPARAWLLAQLAALMAMEGR